METMLRKGQRLRPLHPQLAEREWGVAADAVGTVLCCYRTEVGHSAAHRVDVEFGPGRKIWGAPAEEFAVIHESAPAH